MISWIIASLGASTLLLAIPWNKSIRIRAKWALVFFVVTVGLMIAILLNVRDI